MDRKLIDGAVFVATLLMPALAAAQQPPKNDAPVAPKAEQLDSANCAHADTRSTTGKGSETGREKPAIGDLSDKLARSSGVICPPDQQMDPEIKAPTPPSGKSMPVIPPPGSPGGGRNVQPK